MIANMNDFKLIYEQVESIKVKPINNRVILRIDEVPFDSKSLITLVGKFKYLLIRNFMKYTIILKFKKIDFKDKITYLILDSLIFDVLTRSNFCINIMLEDEIIPPKVHNNGFNSTALYQSCYKGVINREKFLKIYTNNYYDKDVFKKFLKRSELEDGEITSKLGTEIATISRMLIEDEEFIDDLVEILTELICNVKSHTTGECLLHVDFLKVNSTWAINIGVLNFSNERLFDKIEEGIENHKYIQDDPVYKIVYEAYERHKKFFDEYYNREHFFLITAFQNHVTSRNYQSGSGGTGLTTLIKNIIGKADKDYSYVLSGNHILVFEDEFLKISKDKVLGFNKENDYLNTPPDYRVLQKSHLYVPGTIYQLLIIKEM